MIEWLIIEKNNTLCYKKTRLKYTITNKVPKLHIFCSFMNFIMFFYQKTSCNRFFCDKKEKLFLIIYYSVAFASKNQL